MKKLLPVLVCSMLCGLSVEAAEYICVRDCPVYQVGVNRAVGEVHEGKRLQGQPDATGQWLTVTRKGRQYNMSLNCFVTAEEVAAKEQKKDQALASIDERIREIQQELQALESRTAEPSNHAAEPRGNAAGSMQPKTQDENPPEQRMAMNMNSGKSLEQKLLEKELRRLERKRNALAGN